MSTQTPETASETVATAPGEMVWCPNGHGNRILEPDDRVPFRCPQCQEPMVAEKPEPVAGSGTEVRLPEVGRIVHVVISQDAAKTTVRPAIVMGRDADGRCLVTIFKHDHDAMPPGLYDGVGVVGYGVGVGQWHWPPQTKGKAETFEHFDS